MDSNKKISIQIKSGLSPDGVVGLLKAVGAGDIVVSDHSITAVVNSRIVAHLKHHTAVSSVAFADEEVKAPTPVAPVEAPKPVAPIVEHVEGAPIVSKDSASVNASEDIGSEQA